MKIIVEKLRGTKIHVGGNKYQYKREYNLKYSQEIVKNVINTFFDVIVESIENGDCISFDGYMVIEPKRYSARRARNLVEDKEMMMPTQYRLKVRPGTKIKNACKKLSEKEFGKMNEER